MSALTDHHHAEAAAEPALNASAPASSSTAEDSKAIAPVALEIDEIHKLLPHRYPFALVDRILEYVPEQYATGLKNVSFNEPHFQGHIPGHPIMPGVLIVEAMAQVGGIVLTQLPGVEGSFFAFAGLDGVRFRRPVVPGDRLVMRVELLSFKRRFGKMQGRATVDGQLVAEAEMLFSLFETT